MSFGLDIANDFAEIVDGLSSVGLLDRNGQQYGLENVLRRAVRTREAAASNGHYTASDVAFHVPITATSSKVTPGWKIIDDDGQWTVLERGIETLRNRHRFVCRNAALVYDLTQRVNLQTATWAKNAAGAQEAAWTTTQTDVPCRWSYISADNEVEHQLRNQPRQVSLFLEQSSLIGPDTRFIATAGDASIVLNVISWVDAESIGKLQQVNCEVVPWPLS